MEDVSVVCLPRPASPPPPPRSRGPLERRQRHSFAVLACLALAMFLRPHAAFGQDDGRWNDGTWSEDEGSWDDGAARGGEPRDGAAPRAYDDAGPSMADFRASLSPYGEWVDTPEYGLVWRPAAADDGFRPYYAGRWAWTNAGWYWVADEPYGWAVYHYGRWAQVSGMGWAWLPGSIWAPAWVSWRWGDGYAGWCALGPRGYVYEQPAYFVIVPQPQFLAPVPHHAEPIARAGQFFSRTRPLPIALPGPRAGPIVRNVAEAVGHPVRPLPIADAPAPPRGGTGAVAGGIVYAYRPRSQPLGRAAGAAEGVPSGGGAARSNAGQSGAARTGPAASPPRANGTSAPQLVPVPRPAPPAAPPSGPRSDRTLRPMASPRFQAGRAPAGGGRPLARAQPSFFGGHVQPSFGGGRALPMAAAASRPTFARVRPGR
ncbi:MAG TPA: DUF6600 domain-containing protein [Myxococcales bacterium]|nr:DUF6600 domain-containing protein [Myxococcales bacterium]